MNTLKEENKFGIILESDELEKPLFYKSYKTKEQLIKDLEINPEPLEELIKTYKVKKVSVIYLT